ENSLEIRVVYKCQIKVQVCAFLSLDLDFNFKSFLINYCDCLSELELKIILNQHFMNICKFKKKLVLKHPCGLEPSKFQYPGLHLSQLSPITLTLHSH
ncbi:hypothetical protein BpHYR1_025848, partial [Brachionus plicatilis]